MKRWTAVTAQDCVQSILAGKSVNSVGSPAMDGQPGVLKTSAVTSGVFRPEENKQIHPDEIGQARVSVRAGTILLCRSNTAALVGATARIDEDFPQLYLSDKLWQITLKETVDPAWFQYFLSLPSTREIMRGNTSGSAAAMKNISKRSFGEVEVMLPPLHEQLKIAEILRTWDDAILSLQSGVDLEQKRYSALANRLIDPGNTPAGGNRRLVRLSEVTRELTKRNAGESLDRLDVMGVSNKVGLFPMRQQTIAEDISRYKILPPKSFAYNPMRINVGSIAMSGQESDVLVSPDYVLFECSEDQLNPEYLLHLMYSNWWIYQMNSSGSGSVRSRIYYKDLAVLHISLPSLEEQNKICEVLAASQRLTTATIRHIELLEEQKRGLMQQLLTGKIRGNVDEGDTTNG